MRILRSIHTLNPAVGGPIESVRQSSAALQRLGHEVEIVTLDPPDAGWLATSPVRTYTLGPGRGSYGYVPGFADWIRQRHGDFDAIVVQGIWQYNSLGVWRGLRGTHTPYFVFPHGMLDPWFKKAYPLKHLKKLLYWPWGERRVLRDARAVLFTSEEERRLARESFSFYRCQERVVNYGTAAPPLDLSAARAGFFDRFPLLRNKRIFLFLGRLHEKKGCDLLIRAFAEQNRAARSDHPLHLVMAGPVSDPKYQEHLQQLASLANEGGIGGASVITFPGMLTGDLKWGAFSAAEAFVLPSHQENFGIAVVEALGCGTPVLVSNKVNIWREIVDDGAGLADEDTGEGTRRLLERWLLLPEADRQNMRAKARECFARRFDMERATASLVQALAISPSSR